jgi:ferredoxin-thioredoxin reductase catalytic subunit
MLTTEQKAAASDVISKFTVEEMRWIEQVHTVSQQNAELYGMMLNPKVDIVIAICHSLVLTNGYCPSATPVQWNYNKCCPCKGMRDDRVCHCTLFVDKV